MPQNIRQNMQYQNDAARGRRPREHVSREDASNLAGVPTSEDLRVPHPEKSWNGSEWRQWDKNHGHVLWMGSVQEDWTNGMIEGFFLKHGAHVTITRKGRENYCFVAFATSKEAQSFMTRYDNQPIPGKTAGGAKFNIRPRTRPRWFREAENGGAGGGGKGGDFRDPHPDRDRGGRMQRKGGGRGKGLRETRGVAGSGPGYSGRGGRGRGRDEFTREPSFRVTVPDDIGRHLVLRRQYRKVDTRSPPRSRSRSRARSDSSSCSESSDDNSASRDGSPVRTRHHRPMHEAPAHSDGGSDRSSLSRSRRTCSTPMGDRSGGRGRGASRGGRPPDPRRSDFVGRNSSDEDRVRHRTTTSSSGFVARAVGPKVSVPKRTIEGDAQQSDIESGELLGRDCSSDEAEGYGRKHFSNDHESDCGEKDSDDGVRDDSGTTTVGNDRETCNPEGSEERAVKVARGACTGEAGSSTTSKSIPDNDISGRSATRSPSSSPGENAHETERGEIEELVSVTDDLPANTARVESGHVTHLQLNHEMETGIVPQNNHVSDHATSAMVAGERQSERVSDRSPTQGGGTIVGRGYRESSFHESAPAGGGSDAEGMHAADPMVDASVISSLGADEEDEAGENGAVDDRSANISRRGFVADLCNVDTAFPEEATIACDKQKDVARACSAGGGSGVRTSEESVIGKDDRRYTRGQTGSFAKEKDDKSLQIEDTRCRPSPSPPTPSLSRCRSSALRLQEDTSISAPRFGNDPRLRAAANRRNRSIAEMSSQKQVSSVFGPLAQKLESASFGGDAPQNLPKSPPRGTKRRNSANITLAQVIDHHMARRRLNEVASSADGLPTQRDSLGRNTLCSTGGTKRKEEAHIRSPSTARKQLVDGSTVVAAAWANGCVLPLTATAASHMRLVAPLLAAEPEGRRVVVRTASAVVAGAAVLALPGYRLEVTGVCRDGLLMELSPKPDLQGELPRESGQSILPSTLGNRLQAAFDKVVSLDLEFDTVPLPHAETFDAVPPGSSSGELLQWRNDGTSTLLYLARVSPAQTGLESEEQWHDGNSDKGEGTEGLSQLGGGCFIGIDSEMGPLLPRTGLLECFHVEIHPVPFPPSDSKSKYHREARSSTVHLAMVLSDSRVFRGGNSGGDSSVARGEGGGQLPSSAVATAPVPGGTEPNPAAQSLRQLSARLCCVPPTRTEGGLAWREITGLKCVAEVSRLAFASNTELEGKIQLVEGLHTAQIASLATKIASSGVLLVILAGRQGASVEVMAARLRMELILKGKQPALLDTKTFLRQGAASKHVAGTGRGKTSTAVAASRAPQHVDSTGLGRAVAALLGQARAGAGLSGSGAGIAATSEWLWCDVVIVHGSEALDVDLLPPGRVGLGPAEAISVFVDAVPQVCVDSLTPVNGADVRMLRSLIAQRGLHKVTERAALVGNVGDGVDSRVGRAPFDTTSFLDDWLLAEETEETIWRSFRAAANAHLNTALPYDLSVLKPLAEPFLRSVAPPTSREDSQGGGGDGCRSSTYALARSVLRVLRLCEALHAPPLPGSSVLSGLIQSPRWA